VSAGWIREAFLVTVGETRLYLRTAAAFTFRPYRAARDWAAGTLRAMNPIGVLASAAVVLGPTRQIGYQLLGVPHPDSLFAMLATGVGPFVHYAVLGLLAQVVLVARPARLADTIGVSLLAGGGPAALAEVLAWATALPLHALFPGAEVQLVLGVPLGAAFTVFAAALGTGLAGLFSSPPWRMMLAFAFAFGATGLIFGVLDPPGEYGMHWTLRPSPLFLGLGW
jgi:hypothetical protein